VAVRSWKNAQKNFALGYPTNDDLNFLDIFYPQILVRFQAKLDFFNSHT
jgi:hypothetical protein